MKYDRNLNIIEYPSDSGISTVHYIRKHDIADAAIAIGAGTSVCLFTWDGVNYDGMTWLTSAASGGIDKPTETELNDKYTRQADVCFIFNLHVRIKIFNHIISEFYIYLITN